MNGGLCFSSSSSSHGFVLTPRQAEILGFVSSYYALTEEGCSAGLLARRLKVSYPAIRKHFEALHEKGILRSPGGRAVPIRPDFLGKFPRV